MGWVFGLILIIYFAVVILEVSVKKRYRKLESEVLHELRLYNWNSVPHFDTSVIVKSRQALEKYDDIKFFKENQQMLAEAEKVIKQKKDVATMLKKFLENNKYKTRFQYNKIEKHIKTLLKDTAAFRIRVRYITTSGNNLDSKEIVITQKRLDKFKEDPSLLMGKAEYNKFIKEQQKEALEKKQHEYYERVNNIIDYANEHRDSLVLKGGQEQLDALIGQLFDRTVNSIKKIKSLDSEEWSLIEDLIVRIKVTAQ